MALVEPTQVKHPNRATFRTVFQGVIGFLAIIPLIITAAGIPPVGLAAILIAVSAAVTRVMALPGVEVWIEKYIPALAAKPQTPLN
jgi:hypothetical protein